MLGEASGDRLRLRVEVIVHDDEIEIAPITQVLNVGSKCSLAGRDLDPGYDRRLEHHPNEGEPGPIGPDWRVVPTQASSLGVEELDRCRGLPLNIRKDQTEAPGCRRSFGYVGGRGTNIAPRWDTAASGVPAAV